MEKLWPQIYYLFIKFKEIERLFISIFSNHLEALIYKTNLIIASIYLEDSIYSF